MSRIHPATRAAIVAVLVAACAPRDEGRGGVPRPIPVEVAPIVRGSLEQHRVLAGSLEAWSSLIVASGAAGRVTALEVALGEEVRRGQVVARLDRGELEQAVREADAAVVAAEAAALDAQVQRELASRALERATRVHAEGASPDSALDAAVGEARRREAAEAIARAAVGEARAARDAARARLRDAEIRADWTGEDDLRVVGARHAAEGSFVAAGEPIVTVVDLDPLRAVVHVTEGERGRVAPGLPATVSSRVRPGETFHARVAHVAPVFDPATRQAVVELEVPNPERALFPGGFVEVDVVLDRVEAANLVPRDALVQRGGADAVFVLPEGASSVSLRPVEVLLADGDVVALGGPPWEGRVVTLGQHLLHDGAAVVVVEGAP